MDSELLRIHNDKDLRADMLREVIDVAQKYVACNKYTFLWIHRLNDVCKGSTAFVSIIVNITK